jgi:endoglucanase
MMPFADRHGISYLGWSWNVADCKGEPALITGYDGTPTPFGIGLRDHLRALAR